MDTFVVERQLPEDPSIIGKRANVSHVKNRIKPNTVIVDSEGTPLIIFGKLDKNFDGIKSFMRHIKYQSNQRLTQKNNNYETARSSYVNFGFKPKRPVFGHAASSCEFNSKCPAWYKELVGLASYVQLKYKENGAEVYKRQESGVQENVLPQWRIPGTIFTQGIINNSNALDYHLDRGNFKDFWSCMVVFRHNIIGGQLVVPSLDLALEVDDYTYVFFNGQKHVHGVSDIEKLAPDAFRYSVVYYALEAMKHCGSSEEEIEKMRNADMVKHRKKMV